MRIAGIGYYLPEKIVDNDQLLQRIKDNANGDIDLGYLQERLNNNKAKYRRFMENETNIDMAVKACQRCLEKANFKAKDIDMIIYCGMSRMFVEPPMAVMLQNKLQAMNADVYDLSNACLGFMNGMEIARLYIDSGKHKNVLLVSAESCSDWIPWKKFSTNKDLTGFSALTISDAAVAMLMQPGGSEHNFKIFDFKTFGQYNDLCQISIGKKESDLEIHVKSKKLAMIAMEILPQFIPTFLHTAKDTLGRLDIWFFHQVTGDPSKFYGPLEDDLVKKSYLTFQDFGNTGTATIPLGMAIAEEKNNLKRGDCVACIIGASGFSYGGTYFVY